MEPPLKPNESDCCNSGCNPCILDVYEEQLKKYQNKILNTATSLKRNCLSLTTYTKFKYIGIVKHTSDTCLLTFQCFDQAKANCEVIYRPGQHFLLKAILDHDQFTRAYTPLPIESSNRTFTIIARFYNGGRMSQFLQKLTLNELTLWRGPYGNFEITYKYDFILLIAQGTGIAPIIGVIHDILKNEECETFLKLFFCCRSEADILLRNELYEYSSFWNFNYEVFLSNACDIKCKYNEIIHPQRLNISPIKMYLQDKFNKEIQVLICGSKEFNQNMLENVLICSLKKENVYLF